MSKDSKAQQRAARQHNKLQSKIKWREEEI